MRRLVIMVCAAILITSCARIKLRHELMKFESIPIVLPESMYVLGPTHHAPDTVKATLIRYVDSTECTSCFLSTIYNYYEIQDLLDSLKGLDFKIIITPSQELIEELQIEILSCAYSLPIFYDVNREFLTRNPTFPTNKLFRCFLVNSKGYPIMIGDPIMGQSERIRPLLKEVFTNIN